MVTTSIFFAALTRALFESCIQGLLIWLLIKAFILFSPRLSANSRYKLQYSGMVLIFVSFVVTLTWHLNELAVHVSQVIYSGEPAPQLVMRPANFSPAYPGRAEALPFNYSRWIALFYLAGLLINSTKLVVAFSQVKRLAANATNHTNAFWEARLTALCGELGISRKVRLYFRDAAEIPFTSGFLKPLVYFPIAALNRLSITQVEAILLHELAHIRRNDYLFNLLQQVMKSFLFFNPFAWLINRDINREREYCCDDLVIAHSGNAGEYATALLQLEEQRGKVPAFAMAASGTEKYPLLNRIKRMIMKTPDPSPVQKITVLAATIAICFSIAWTIPETKVKKTMIRLKEKALSTKSDKPKTRISVIAVTDTVIKPKPRIKIVVEDEKGNKKEYKSMQEVPAELKGDMTGFFAGPEWQKQQEELAKKFSSPEWQKQMEELTKKFSGPEWQKQMEELTKKFSGPEWQKQQDELVKKFSGPEWQKQQEELMKFFGSPEWKKTQEDLMKQFSSPEWKKQQEELIKEVHTNIIKELGTSGTPAPEVIRIRGTSSLNGAEPLIVVDGVPFETKIPAGFNFGTADEKEYGELLNISPADMKDISVLKDAAATAVWGSRAANGVLVINTNRGAGGRQLLKPLYTLTPNGDGKDDVLFISYAWNGNTGELAVYDKNGKAVYTSDNYRNDWHGGDLPAGDYTFVTKWKANGVLTSGSGKISLIR